MNPFFLESRSGTLFAVYISPSDSEPKGALLHVPAFAEEMNKSRHMVMLQANALSKQGYGVLILDLFGTGDSSGDFAEATWDFWLADLAEGVAWLKRQGIERVGLWGLRTGVLLAMDYAKCNPGDISRMLAWQPVFNGDMFVTQFLRLRIAAAIMNNLAPQEKTGDLKRLLQQGRALEVAGYGLNPELMNPLMKLKFDPSALVSLNSFDVLEVVAAQNPQSSFVYLQAIDNLTNQGIATTLTTVTGEQFWASQEITTAPALLNVTLEKIRLWH